MILKDVYQVLTGSDRLAHGDEFTLDGLTAEHIWGPCSSFLGKLVSEVEQRGRIIFRRRIAQDEVQT